MKKNLRDDTRFQQQWDDANNQKDFGWMPVLVLLALIALFAYLIFR